MNARELYGRMEERFGRFPDGGVVCDNGEEIDSVVCEIDWFTLYNMMVNRHTLYVVQHPVSDFALALSQINPDEHPEDVRAYVGNWLLEFRARELSMNLAVAHTMADKLLETRLSERLEGARGREIVTRADTFFSEYFDPHPALVVLPPAARNGAHAGVLRSSTFCAPRATGRGGRVSSLRGGG